MAFDNLRDCKAWADENLKMSTTSNEASKLYDDVIRQYVMWNENEQNGGMEATLEKMMAADKDFVMGGVLVTGLELMATGRTIRLDKEFKSLVSELEMAVKFKVGNERERLHCKAIIQFANEEYYKACDTWEEILLLYPNDTLALKFAHDAYFYLGNSIMIKDSVGRVLPQYKPENLFHGYVKGMYAFGLEEVNLYDLALKYSTDALSLNPTDCWATHAKAHCFEMLGKTEDGIEFMKSTESDWSKGGMLACHNYWHWALYHVERGENDAALSIYDTQVTERVKSGAALDIVDAASLLKRLELQDVDIDGRWDQIYDICRPHLDDHIMAFNDAHYLMSFLGSSKGKTDSTHKKFMKSTEKFISSSKATSNREIFTDAGLNILKGLVAYNEKRFDDASNFLFPVKNKIFKIGGSNAQRDVFSQILISACIQSKDKRNVSLGLALINERKLTKENSPLTDRLMSRWLACHEKN